MMENAHLIGAACIGVAIALCVAAAPGSIWRLGASIVHRRSDYYLDLLDQLNRFEEKPSTQILYELAFAVMGAGLLYAVFTAPVMAFLGGAIGFMLPGLLLRQQLVSRRRRLDELFPDALISLSSSVRAGLSLPDAIEQTAQNMPAPASEEFALMSRKYKSGMTMNDVLEDTAARLNSRYFDLISVALTVNIERGGDLTEILERISASLREIHRLEEKIRTETAGPRFEGRVMLFVPPFVLGMLYMVEPELVDTMFNSVIGVVIILMAAVMMGIAFMVMNRIVNEEV